MSEVVPVRWDGEEASDTIPHAAEPPDAREPRGSKPARVDRAGESALGALRRAVALIEGVPAERLDGPEPGAADGTRLALGVPVLDGLLHGGIRAGLTELRLEETRGAGAGVGFALAVGALSRPSARRPLVWIGQARLFEETGEACRAGVAGLGLDPDALVLVRTRRLEEAVWAGEEAVRSGAVALVVLEVRGNPKLMGLEGTRRLHLRGQRSGVPCLLLRQAGEAEPTAAPFRIRVRPEASAPGDTPRLIGPPAFDLVVEKSLDGRHGHVTLEWNADDHRFLAAPALPGLVAAAPADGPDPAARTGRVVAFPSGSVRSGRGGDEAGGRLADLRRRA